jgi:KaiC/GvpD/RAD55 family RecA-like ATPase
VEYDPASQWYNASLTIGAGWIKDGGRLSYHTAAQMPDKVRSQFDRLGFNARLLENEGKLELWDWYSCTLGRKSTEKLAMESLRVADMSIWWAKHRMHAAPTPDTLRIVDDVSSMARVNEEKSWVDFIVSRVVPSAAMLKSTRLIGMIRGTHSDWAYKTLEAAHDGIIDIRLKESGDEPKELIRIRTMRNVGFDRKWHELKLGKKLDISLGDA